MIVLPKIEQGTFCVLNRYDTHNTTKTDCSVRLRKLMEQSVFVVMDKGKNCMVYAMNPYLFKNVIPTSHNKNNLGISNRFSISVLR